jgi:ATP-dependent DNA ligase
LEGDGPTVFADACKLDLEGIDPKRKDSAYRSGRSPHWLKMKNPTARAHRGIVMFAMGKREQIERADRIKSG